MAQMLSVAATATAERKFLAVVSDCDASPVLEPAEHPLDEVASFVSDLVERIGRASGGI